MIKKLIVTTFVVSTILSTSPVRAGVSYVREYTPLAINTGSCKTEGFRTALRVMYEILTDPEKQSWARGVTGRFPACLKILAREARLVTTDSKSKFSIDKQIRQIEADMEIPVRKKGKLGELFAFVADYIQDGMPTEIQDYKMIKFGGQTLNIAQAIDFFTNLFDPKTTRMHIPARLSEIYQEEFGSRAINVISKVVSRFRDPPSPYLTPARLKVQMAESEALELEQYQRDQKEERKKRNEKRRSDRAKIRDDMRAKYGLSKSK